MNKPKNTNSSHGRILLGGFLAVASIIVACARGGGDEEDDLAVVRQAASSEGDAGDAGDADADADSGCGSGTPCNGGCCPAGQTCVLGQQDAGWCVLCPPPPPPPVPPPPPDPCATTNRDGANCCGGQTVETTNLPTGCTTAGRGGFGERGCSRYLQNCISNQGWISPSNSGSPCPYSAAQVKAISDGCLGTLLPGPDSGGAYPGGGGDGTEAGPVSNNQSDYLNCMAASIGTTCNTVTCGAGCTNFTNCIALVPGLGGTQQCGKGHCWEKVKDPVTGGCNFVDNNGINIECTAASGACN